MLSNCKGRNIKLLSALVALKSSTTQIVSGNIYLLSLNTFVHTGHSNQSDYNKIWSSSNRTRWVFKRHNHPTFIAFFISKLTEVTFSLHCLIQLSIFYTQLSVLYIQDEEETTEISDGYVTVALGNTWSHNVNTRLILQYLDGEKRQVSIQLNSHVILVDILNWNI